MVEDEKCLLGVIRFMGFGFIIYLFDIAYNLKFFEASILWYNITF
jgi:hypothetical protein